MHDPDQPPPPIEEALPKGVLAALVVLGFTGAIILILSTLL